MPARAQPGDAPKLFVEAPFGPQLSAVLQRLGSGVTGAVQPEVTSSPLEAACSLGWGDVPRLAWLRGAPLGLDSGRCVDNPDARFVYVPIGYRAVALVAPSRAPVWSVASADLFRVMGAATHRNAVRLRWNEISPGAPGLAAGVSTGLEDADLAALLMTRVLRPGCLATDSVAASAAPPSGQAPAVCGVARMVATLRAAPPLGPVASWAPQAPAGQVGLVDAATLGHLDPALRVLPLDDVLPTPANIAAQRYKAAEPMGIMVVLPRTTAPDLRKAASALAFELLSEAVSGPDGLWSGVGLVAPPAPVRVEARAKAVGFLLP